MKHRIVLDHDLSPGWIQPWVDGLLAGKVIARVCRTCGRTSFAPQRVCSCGETDGDWRPLSGLATIVRQTKGADGHFAVAQFDGADNHVVVRLEGFDGTETRGRLKAADGPLPQLVLQPIGSKTDR